MMDRKVTEAIPIVAIEPSNGRAVLKYESMNQAELDGWRKSHLSRCYNKKKDMYKGYIWMSEEDYLKKNGILLDEFEYAN